MTHLRTKITGLLLILPLLFGAGCDRTVPPPAPLALEELPTAFQTAFSKAKPELKELASQFVASVQAKEYPKAFAELQNLTSQPALSKEQVSVTTGALLTVNSLLQEAQSQGDAKATETIKTYRETK